MGQNTVYLVLLIILRCVYSSHLIYCNPFCSTRRHPAHTSTQSYEYAGADSASCSRASIVPGTYVSQIYTRSVITKVRHKKHTWYWLYIYTLHCSTFVLYEPSTERVDRRRIYAMHNCLCSSTTWYVRTGCAQPCHTYTTQIPRYIKSRKKEERKDENQRKKEKKRSALSCNVSGKICHLPSYVISLHHT